MGVVTLLRREKDCVGIINKMKWWDDILEKIKKPKKAKNGDEGANVLIQALLSYSPSVTYRLRGFLFVIV